MAGRAVSSPVAPLGLGARLRRGAEAPLFRGRVQVSMR